MSSSNKNQFSQKISKEFLNTVEMKYSYNFKWLGRPIIQYPQDIVAMQELIWKIKPDLIIETGIAHGGSLIMSASMLTLLDYCELNQNNEFNNKLKSTRKVIGIDIDIRAHNKNAILSHPLASKIEMIEGSSVDPKIVNQIHKLAKNYKNILLCLDSNHTHEHVLNELKAYASLVSLGSYCVVFDTVIDDIPNKMHIDRDWGPGNSPKTAIFEFLKTHPEFEIDKEIDEKLIISVAPNGYLKKLSNVH